MHLRYDERELHYCVVRVAAVDALIASFMSIGTLALLNDKCEKSYVFLRTLVVM